MARKLRCVDYICPLETVFCTCCLRRRGFVLLDFFFFKFSFNLFSLDSSYFTTENGCSG